MTQFTSNGSPALINMNGSLPDESLIRQINASAGAINFAPAETPSGLINGANVTYTLSKTPIAGSLMYFTNGVLQTSPADYTLVGATITRVTAMIAGATPDTHTASYRY